MEHNLNVVGKYIAKFHRQRGWTREELAAKLQLFGCNITPQILANIETRGCSVTDCQIVFFSEVFRIPAEDFFPLKSQSKNGTVQLPKK
jgi:transcriptional regulator with XRE-family HTH domain